MSASGGGGGVGVGSGGSSMDRAESSAGSGTGGGGVGVGGGGELAPWPTGADGYKLDRIIGNGAFATVWKAFCPARGVHVAVKVMDLENVTHSFEDIRQEVAVMRMCNHPNVLSCYTSFVHENELWLVMEFMSKGSCLHVMNVSKREGKGEGMKEEWIAYVLKQTLQGLKYFHDQGQIHRDIKAGNILLGEDGRVKLADFGVAGWLVGYGNRRNVAKTFVGTPCWMAPEVMEQVDGYNQKADIWSVGITALELAKGHAPYARLEPMKVLMQTIEREPPSLKSYPDDRQPGGDVFGRNFKEVVRFCLQKNPKERPNCSSLLGKKFFKRDLQPNSLVKEMLVHVPVVGEGESGHDRRESGGYGGDPLDDQMTLDAKKGWDEAKTARMSSSRGEDDSGHGRPPKVAPPDHPKGTTWVWDDGSGVVLKADDVANEEREQRKAEQKEENDGFYDEMESFGHSEWKKKK
ncbi:unnamed protein product [Ascophyllum nodosum]